MIAIKNIEKNVYDVVVRNNFRIIEKEVLDITNIDDAQKLALIMKMDQSSVIVIDGSKYNINKWTITNNLIEIFVSD